MYFITATISPTFNYQLTSFSHFQLHYYFTSLTVTKNTYCNFNKMKIIALLRRFPELTLTKTLLLNMTV